MDRNDGAVIRHLLVGIIATAIFDLYLAFIQPRIFKSPFTGFSGFGRWVGNFPKGRFVYADFKNAAPIPYEKQIGWIGHYVVGILFAGILVALWPAWIIAPTLLPAMIIGIGSVVAPLCIIQPAHGYGFFALKTPNPKATCIRALASHTVFGFSLYAAGLVVASLVL